MESHQPTQSCDTYTADVSIIDGGSVFLFLLLTERAREWVDDYVSDDRFMLGDGLAVEHRYAPALAAGMQSDGLALDVQGGL
jgi:hypothetical protein